MRLIFLFVACLIGVAQPVHAEIPVLDFFKDSEVSSISLSPTGEFLAVSIPQGDRTILAAFRSADMSLVGKWDYGEKKHIETVRWVTNDRFLMYVTIKSGRNDLRSLASDLYASNVDGTKRIDIPNGAYYSFVSTLWEDPSNVLVQRSIERATLFKMNVFTGDIRPVMTAPLDSGSFFVDYEGNVKFAAGQQDDLETLTLRRDGDEWTTIHRSNIKGGERSPVAVTRDGTSVIFAVSDSGEPLRLVRQDAETGKESILSTNPRVDPSTYLMSSDGLEILAVKYEDGTPGYEFINKDHSESKLYAGLINAFPDHVVSLSGTSRDGRFVLFRTYSDVDPGSYYLFDQESGEAKFVLASMDWIKPEQMSEQRPISLKARDGTPLYGYLTVPRGSSGTNLPMVLHPHGGPFGIRDQWGFDPTVQFLASRGYAVLQLNFRGSGGYGTKFERSGYKKWGTELIDDMTDAVDWVVRQGIADKERICTFGASYGGYAALQAVVREQGKYRCAIGYIGVYDIPRLFKDGDTQDSVSGRNVLKLFFPESLSEQQAQSPAFNAERLTVPVMIAHGAKDPRAPMSQYESLISRMKDAGKAPEISIVKEKEAHGFVDTANQVELYTAVEGFLEKYIGDKRAAAPASP
jgi:dipeptidyl aminopeptidase/acylaminoacyl peptidase